MLQLFWSRGLGYVLVSLREQHQPIDWLVSEFIKKCIGDVVPTVTIKTYPNQKPWMDGGICEKLKVWTTAFNNGNRSGNMAEYKLCSYSLRKAIKQEKCQYRDKVESQFNGSGTRRMWQGLQEITDYKKKTNHVTDTDVMLPDKLNTFFARFEDNTVPPSRPASTLQAHYPSFTLLLLSVHHICIVTLTISTCTYYLNQPD